MQMKCTCLLFVVVSKHHFASSYKKIYTNNSMFYDQIKNNSHTKLIYDSIVRIQTKPRKKTINFCCWNLFYYFQLKNRIESENSIFDGKNGEKWNFIIWLWNICFWQTEKKIWWEMSIVSIFRRLHDLASKRLFLLKIRNLTETSNERLFHRNYSIAFRFIIKKKHAK